MPISQTRSEAEEIWFDPESISHYDRAVIDAELRRRLSVYFGDIEDASVAITALGVGKDVVVSQMIGLVMAVAGVYAVEVSQPAQSVSIAPNQFPELGTLTITMEAPSNE